MPRHRHSAAHDATRVLPPEPEPRAQDTAEPGRVDWTIDLLVIRRTVVVFALVFLGLMMSWGFVRAWWIHEPIPDRSEELATVHQRIAQAEREGARLRRELRTFAQDRRLRERAIRSRLGMLRPGERFVIFDDHAPEPGAVTPAPRALRGVDSPAR